MSDHPGKQKLDELVAGLDGVTPGSWSPFIDDSGDEWTGWPLSISADSITDKTIVRPGGFYPYSWDAKTSQHEAVANAAHIARCDPDTIRSISDAYRAMERENARLAREALSSDGQAHEANERALKAEAENERLRKQLAFSDEHASKIESLLDPHIEWKDSRHEG